MLPVTTTHRYTPQGLFGAVRKHDIHTGVDFYCKAQELVRCVADGVVKEVIDFTGSKAGSPWWHNTQAVAVELSNGTTMVYGEILPAVQPRQKVCEGQILGWVQQVLLRDKGTNPPCMLHFELWNTDYQSNYTWSLKTPKPQGLMNPLSLFNFWVIKTPYGYRIETHDGHYWKYFNSAIDCKSYCQSRTDESDEVYVYLRDDILNTEYRKATRKI